MLEIMMIVIMLLLLLMMMMMMINFLSIGKPLLLGPGMHYFNDLNLAVGNEIDMNFKGNNQIASDI
jgi:hypothetical protein